MRTFRDAGSRGVTIAMLAVIALSFGCSNDDDSEAVVDPEANEAQFRASGIVSSLTSLEIETTTGARIDVPVGAVPRTGAGGTGTMTFSIERDAASNPALPAGASTKSTVYKFGPEGFVFAMPVEVAIPVEGDPAAENVRLFRINPTTGAAEAHGGTYDPETKVISAATFELSSWFAAVGGWAAEAYGCIHVVNGSGEWVEICTSSAELAFPETDAAFDGAASLWCGTNCLNWASEGNWHLPQGTYRLCVSAGSPTDTTQRHYFIDDVVIDTPWSSAQPVCAQVVIGTIGAPGTLGTTAGACDCRPAVTPAVGTGDLQITLTWHSASAIDLDLWVTDPSGEKCFYGNLTTASGGELDRDNRCDNYIDGRPENVFWATAPPGNYKIEVDWFPTCGTGLTGVGYDVRVVNRGSARTYSGTSRPDPRTIEVATITVGAAKTEFGPLTGVPGAPREYPPKR